MEGLPTLGLQQRLAGVRHSWPNIFGTEITGSLQPLYLPGFVVLAVLAGLVWLVRSLARR